MDLDSFLLFDGFILFREAELSGFKRMDYLLVSLLDHFFKIQS